jgi:hypothetical protein
MSEGLQNMEIHELPSKVYCSWMHGIGRWARMGVQGDGSCFFHSVCALKNENDYLFKSPSEQRDIAYAFRCDLKKHFTREAFHKAALHHPDNDNYEQKKRDFCVPKTWADETMIRFASKTLNLNLIFIDMLNGHAYCGVHGIETLEGLRHLDTVKQKTGLIAWIEHRHFEPIIRIDDVNEKEGKITTLFSTHEDKEVVYKIMSEYVQGCKI